MKVPAYCLQFLGTVAAGQHAGKFAALLDQLERKGEHFGLPVLVCTTIRGKYEMNAIFCRYFFFVFFSRREIYERRGAAFFFPKCRVYNRFDCWDFFAFNLDNFHHKY